MIRAFAALPLPAGHRRRLAAYLEACGRSAPAFRWAGAEGLHLTLRFAGNLEEDVAGRLAERLRHVHAPSFAVRLGGLGTFGGRRHASVVWLGLDEGVEPCTALAAACEAACQEVGLDPERHAFRPHLTLARARDRRGAALPDLPPPLELAGWHAREFVLFRSVLHGGRPPEYVPIERYPLDRGL